MGREENKADKRHRIAGAAAELFRERGFDAVTTQEIAERAGVAKGTVFLYAPTKAALVALVFEDRIRETEARAFATVPEGASLADEIEHVFGCFLAAYAEHPDLARLFLKELSFASGDTRRAREDVDRAFLARLAERIAAHGTDAEAPPLLAAISFFAMYLLALQAWLSGALPSADAARAQLRAMVDLAIRGIAGRKVDPCTTRSEPSPTKGTSRSATRGRSTSTRGASATAATKRRGSR